MLAGAAFDVIETYSFFFAFFPRAGESLSEVLGVFLQQSLVDIVLYSLRSDFDGDGARSNSTYGSRRQAQDGPVNQHTGRASALWPRAGSVIVVVFEGFVGGISWRDRVCVVWEC